MEAQGPAVSGSSHLCEMMVHNSAELAFINFGQFINIMMSVHIVHKEGQ